MLKLCYTRNDGAPINDQAKKTIEIEERITKNIEEKFKKKMEDDQARREADMQQYLMQMTPEPNWLARALETGYSSQTQGNFQHLLSQNNTQMSHMQMMPHQPYQFHPPIFPRIQPTFELGAPYIPTPPQVENANVNFGTNARNKDNGNNYEE